MTIVHTYLHRGCMRLCLHGCLANFFCYVVVVMHGPLDDDCVRTHPVAVLSSIAFNRCLPSSWRRSYHDGVEARALVEA